MIVWLYHRVLPQKSSAAVEVRVFERQLAFLKDSGYTILTTAELLDIFEGKIQIPKKSVMLSFDDGWADNLFHAEPILAKFACKAVLALNTGLANDKSSGIRSSEDIHFKDSKTALKDAVFGSDRSSFLNWDEIRKLGSNGRWEIEAHGDSHRAFFSDLRHFRGFHPEKTHWSLESALGVAPFDGAPRAEMTSSLAGPIQLPAPELMEKLRISQNDKERRKICRDFRTPLISVETGSEFALRLRADLNSCADKIERETGKRPKALFWPWGHYCEEGVRIAADCGFRLLFSTERSAVENMKDPLHIPRIPAPDSLDEFKSRLKRYSNPLLSLCHGLIGKFRKL